jgi:hypothetical protein
VEYAGELTGSLTVSVSIYHGPCLDGDGMDPDGNKLCALHVMPAEPHLAAACTTLADTQARHPGKLRPTSGPAKSPRQAHRLVPRD